MVYIPMFKVDLFVLYLSIFHCLLYLGKLPHSGNSMKLSVSTAN